MDNPFKQDGEMLPIASINSLYVDDIKAYDLFRPSLLQEALIEHKDALGWTELPHPTAMLAQFNDLLQHELDSVQRQARTIARTFGDRLAMVLGTLFAPSEQSVLNRTNWTPEHWAYWKSIRHLYLVGGMTAPRLTKIFYQSIQSEFVKRDIREVTVTFVEGSQNMGTRGLATLVEDGEHLLFDFGQTAIKRAHHIKEEGRTVIDVTLPTKPARHLFYKSPDESEVIRTAHQLDDYIVDVINDTANDVSFAGNTIHMAIANYVRQGRIYSARGGYGKLAYVADNYQQHLSHRLSESTQRSIQVVLHHDTSAMGLLYREEPHTAVLSLGTAFGVTFID
jgi:hypothetical protein